jgi:hypothetical protein
MTQVLSTFLHSHAAGMLAAALGFVGALILLWATWRTAGVRKTILQGFQIETADPKIKEGVAVLLGKLNAEQLRLLREEHRLNLLGAATLAAGFVIAFFRELY